MGCPLKYCMSCDWNNSQICPEEMKFGRMQYGHSQICSCKFVLFFSALDFASCHSKIHTLWQWVWIGSWAKTIASKHLRDTHTHANTHEHWLNSITTYGLEWWVSMRGKPVQGQRWNRELVNLLSSLCAYRMSVLGFENKLANVTFTLMRPNLHVVNGILLMCLVFYLQNIPNVNG